jgi:hypothetical protein
MVRSIAEAASEAVKSSINWLYVGGWSGFE